MIFKRKIFITEDNYKIYDLNNYVYGINIIDNEVFIIEVKNILSMISNKYIKFFKNQDNLFKFHSKLLREKLK